MGIFKNISGVSKKAKVVSVPLALICFLLLFTNAGIRFDQIIMYILPGYLQNSKEEAAEISHNILISDNTLDQFEVPANNDFIPTKTNIHQITDMQGIEKYLFNIDSSAYVTAEDLKIDELVNLDLTTELQVDEPKILIFHTHSQEAFIDSGRGVQEETIVGVGNRLAEILANDYGISVVHDTGSYDVKDGKLVRGESYENMEPAVQKIVEKYPSIEIAIDLHRDGVPDNMHLVEEINGRPTAKIMFFNGITRYNNNGVPMDLTELENPYIKENLAFSLQLFLKANELYPGFARKTYIKPYRYSLHLKPKSMLVEVGANTNTLEEALNAMGPLAEIIVATLEGE